ncbi:MobA/MobL family protein [Pseudomonas lundensis]|uniref:MobA/MobL family protein n=1 Tax=Pseudomonas lundensis TaxID=86185 RepID=UPI00390825B6
MRAELSPAQRRELTQGIAQALADRYGTAGTLAVHTPDREGDQRNHHAHILMTTRRLEPSGALGEKTRELDDVKRGPEEIEWVRAMIEARPNHALERAGSAERVDRRSLFEQRAPLGTVTRLQANNDRRQLTADRDELGAVSAQIIDIEQARAAVREVEMAGKTSALIIEKATRIAVSEAVSGALAAVRYEVVKP